MNRRVRTWFKRIGIAVAIVLVLLGVFAWWLLGSQSGARFALQRAQAALDNKLSVAQLQGSLVSPLELHDITYRDPKSGIDIHIKKLKVDYSLSGLFSRQLHVRALDIQGVNVQLHTVVSAPASAPRPSLQSLLTPPLALVLDQAQIRDITIAQDGASVFVANSLRFSANWNASALSIRQLALRAPDGSVDLNATLASYRDYRGNAQARFDWRIGDQRASGKLLWDGNGKLSTLTLALDKPTRATLKATLAASLDALPWSLIVDVPAFDPATIGIDNDKLKSLALQLQGSGDRLQGKLSGNIDINAHHILLDPFAFAVSAQTLMVHDLRLRDDSGGALQVRGKLQLDAQPVRADLDANWTGVELPADLFGQALLSHGTLQAHGTAAQFSAQSELAIGPPEKLANLAVKLDATPEKIELLQFDLKQAGGGLTAHGSIGLQPDTTWNFDATAKNLNPGAFVKSWPGALNFVLSTNGTVRKSGIQAKLVLDHLGGTLRQRALHGSADLAFASPFAIDGKFNLSLGQSSVRVSGASLAHTDLNIDLDIPQLGDWVPQSQGSVSGSIDVNGTWPQLAAQGHINGKNFLLDGVRADSLKLTLAAEDLRTPSGHAALSASKLALGDYLFDTFSLDARGKAAALAVALSARGPKLALHTTAQAVISHDKQGKPTVAATLSRLELAPSEQPAWLLDQAVPISYADGEFSIGQLCLSASPSQLCVSAAKSAGTTRGKFRINQLSLAGVAGLLRPDAPTRIRGIIDGSGNIVLGADGSLAGQASLESASGSIAYPDNAQKPLIAYSALRVNATLGAQQSDIDIHAKLNDRGHLDGHIALSAASENAIALSGQINAHLENLGVVDLLSGQTAATKGILTTSLKLSGTTQAPHIAGVAKLTDFSTEVPSSGLKLHDGNVILHSDDGRAFVLDAAIQSGNGKLTVTGEIAANGEAPLALKINGENFLAVDIPGARVLISPQLTLARKDGVYILRGEITIPKATVDLTKLPGGGSAQSSPDVVITDAKAAPAQSKLLLDADITLKLGSSEKSGLDLRQGQDVHLIGFGLDGYLSGQLAVHERPGQATTARGQVVVNGTYKAYGQDLKIDRGRLLFAGTPIENPGLDIRATRSGFSDDRVTVGLQIRGTAQRPILTVFSDPAMEQSNALSYLVAGKPLNQLGSGEGDAVGSAARALGSAGGDLLAKSIGSRLGFDDVGVADNSAVGGTALTIGKYLSPRLYVSYGVGLFTPGEVVTLRYRLSRLFDIEVRNGTLSSRIGINYKIEK